MAEGHPPCPPPHCCYLLLLSFLQLALPVQYRLRAWIGSPFLQTWVRPSDSVPRVLDALGSDDKLIVEVGWGKPCVFPNV